jgi:hypothetical protein
VEALQEVEPLKRLEGSINRTMIWQHVRPSLCCLTMSCACWGLRPGPGCDQQLHMSPSHFAAVLGSAAG